MNNIENAWHCMGRAFSFLSASEQSLIFQKLDLHMNNNSTSSKFKKDKFILIANEIRKEENKYIINESKELYSKSIKCKEKLTPEEAQYYFFWGSDSQSINNVLTFKEVSEKWNKDPSTLRRNRINGVFKEDEVRKSGNVWLISKREVERVYGKEELDEN